MLPIGLAFIFIAAISFLGFAINAMFNKLKITNVLPLILIGVLIGPVLHILSTGSQSLISNISPYITAVAISFVLFDVGLNIKFKSLGSVLLKATKFTLIVQILIGVAASAIVYFGFGWNVVLSLIFGFAVSGPSSIITPTLVKQVDVSENIKTTLNYEGVVSDVLQLIVPLTLLGILVNTTGSTYLLGTVIFTEIVGAIMLGVVSAFFWLYILNRFNEYATEYSWVLTVSMIIATYGIATQLNLNATLTVFLFGLIFGNISHTKSPADKKPSIIEKYFNVGEDAQHIMLYQKEVVLFVSTFFFVYIGLLFNSVGFNITEVIVALLVALVIIPIRYLLTTPLLGSILSKDPKVQDSEKALIYFNVPRGLATAIVATLPLSYGLSADSFINTAFLVILLTNILFTFGVMYNYKPPQPQPAKKPDTVAPAKKTDSAAAKK